MKALFGSLVLFSLTAFGQSKTDLKEFDLSTTPEMQAREAILKATFPNLRPGPAAEHPDLLEPIGANEAIVVWKEPSLRRRNPVWPTGSRELTWEEFAEASSENEEEMDAASAAILSGPIQINLDSSRGNHLLLPHLPLLKMVIERLNDRAILALRDGKRDVAWTNLLAAARMVTAWKAEPLEISHQVRFNNAKLVFKATWQVLQTNGWSNAQLAHLQEEWENADFVGPLPETQAFKRASDLQMLRSDSLADGEPDSGMAEDAERLLTFYRDREIEYRDAAKAKSWQQARALPGVTNAIFFEPKHQYQRGFNVQVNQRKITSRFSASGLSLMEHAAETEAQRRILITAIALERYRQKHKSYPDKLASLAPEFLKIAPTDFMTDEPLRYRVTSNRFLLYSVGLDCADNGGKLEAPLTPEQRSRRLMNPNAPKADHDIVWPFDASTPDAVAFRKRQSQAEAEHIARREAEIRAESERAKARAETLRDEAMKKLLARKPSLGQEPIYNGKPLSAWVIRAGGDDFNGAPDDAVEAIRAIGPRAVPFLLEWMPRPGAAKPVEGFPVWDAIDTAWWALGANGEAAIPELARWLNEPMRGLDAHSVWSHAAKALSYLGPKAIEPMLSAAIKMQDKREVWELVRNFENLGTNGAPAVPALVQWANHPEYFVRSAVATALGGIGKGADIAVPVLLNALRTDTNSMVRRDAAEALGAFANDSETVLPELIKTLRDPHWEARGGALSGLGKIQNKSEVVQLIAPFLYDTNNVLQRTAAYALRDLESEAAYRALLQAKNAPSSWPGIGDIIHQAEEKAQKKGVRR